MAEVNDSSIREIVNLINKNSEKWAKEMPAIENKLLDEIIALSNELELINNKIKPSINNIRLIIKIKEKLNKLIEKDEYKQSLKDIENTIGKITQLQNNYFNSVVNDFKVPKVLNEIDKQARQSIIEQLGINGISTAVLEPVKNILLKNVTGGGSKDDFIDEVRGYLTKTDGGDGKLTRYTSQIVTDSLNQYSRTYNQILTNDLGFEWFMYLGSNKETTRDFCRAVTECDDLEYIHVSQFKDLIKGNICGKEIPINEKTGLPNGMIEGTNEFNLYVNAGGYRCNHQFIGVPEDIVPERFLNKINKKQIKEEKLKTRTYSKAKIISKSNLDSNYLLSLTGLPEDFNGDVKIFQDTYNPNILYIKSQQEYFSLERRINLEEKTIYNSYFEIDNSSKYKGQGSKIFKDQVDYAINDGFKYIETEAAGGNYNGYYTWARLGYLPKFQKEVEPYIEDFNKKYGTNIKNFEELMAIKEGQEYWKNEGTTFNGICDLSEGSYSRRTLENYIKQKYGE